MKPHGSRTLLRSVLSLSTAFLLIGHGTAAAEPIVENGLEAFLTFEEGGGSTTADLTGNGHSATRIGGASWGDGYLACSAEGQVILIDPAPELRSPTFTYDLWFEAASNTGAYGRIIAQASQPSGNGPDVMEYSGSGRPAIRIVNGNVGKFSTPTIGTVSKPDPPDHFGICSDSFHREQGPDHLVVTHDAASKTVRMFLGSENEPLSLCFEAQYTGTYSVDNKGVGIGNHPGLHERVFRARFYQFAYYPRLLSYDLNSQREVVGGDIFDNHQAGPAAELPDPGPGDAGPQDAAVADAEIEDTGAADSGTADSGIADSSMADSGTKDAESDSTGPEAGMSQDGSVDDAEGGPASAGTQDEDEASGCACRSSTTKNVPLGSLGPLLGLLWLLRRRREHCRVALER